MKNRRGTSWMKRGWCKEMKRIWQEFEDQISKDLCLGKAKCLLACVSSHVIGYVEFNLLR